jgi:4-hydroxybenzoate polyprenyltransferase
MWIKGLFISGVAFVLLFTLANNATFQPIGAYATLIVALGAAVWNINGVMKDDETRDRALAAVGVVVALAVTALAAMSAFG